jgi:hypothetical protein
MDRMRKPTGADPKPITIDQPQCSILKPVVDVNRPPTSTMKICSPMVMMMMAMKMPFLCRPWYTRVSFPMDLALNSLNT